jgi:hypothetical protein
MQTNESKKVERVGGGRIRTLILESCAEKVEYINHF